MAFFLSVHAALLSSSWSLLGSVRACYYTDASRAAAPAAWPTELYASVMYSDVFELLLMGAAGGGKVPDARTERRSSETARGLCQRVGAAGPSSPSSSPIRTTKKEMSLSLCSALPNLAYLVSETICGGSVFDLHASDYFLYFLYFPVSTMRLDSVKLYNYNFIPKVEEEVALYSTRIWG